MPRGQMLFSVGFIAYLALVLPFICWGALADPGHPHSGPHFVFSAPPNARYENAFLARIAALSNDICGDQALADSVPLPFPIAAGTDADSPAGQSLPDSVLALLVLAAVGAWVYSIRLQRTSQQFSLPLSTPRFALLVPTPPPRLT